MPENKEKFNDTVFELQNAVEQAESALGNVKAAADVALQNAEMISAGAAATVGVDPFIFRLAIFVLAIFVGYYVVWSVTPALHTPLMAVTNAVSSVIIVGALLAVGVSTAQGGSVATMIFGFFGLILAGVNIVGGFFLTYRMLEMYKKKST